MAPKNAFSATVAHIISISSNLKGDNGRKRVVRRRQTAQRTEEAVRKSKAVDFSSPPTTQQTITTTYGSKVDVHGSVYHVRIYGNDKQDATV